MYKNLDTKDSVRISNVLNSLSEVIEKDKNQKCLEAFGWLISFLHNFEDKGKIAPAPIGDIELYLNLSKISRGAK